MKRHAVRYVLGVILALAAAAIALRLIVGCSGAARLENEFGLSPVDLVIGSFLLLVVLLVIGFLWQRRNSRRALSVLRRRYPDSVVLRVILRSQDDHLFQAGAHVTQRYKSPQVASAAITGDWICWFIGVRPKLAAKADIVPGGFRLAELPHNFTVLLARTQAEGGAVELPMIPMREASFFPRSFDGAMYQALLKGLCDDSPREGNDEMAPRPAPGWYQDPEESDLERWWDGRQWSDTEFRPPPRESASRAVLSDYVQSYKDQLPDSPTNAIARSTLIASFIALAGVVVLLVLALDLRTARLSTVSAVLLAGCVAAFVFFAVWNVIVSAIAIVNGRRHAGRRLGQAVVSLALSCVAVACGVWALMEALPHAYEVLRIAW